MKMELVDTSDGSPTIFLPEMDEQYHSLYGAVTESNHVFIQNGLLYYSASDPVIFEVGFGTGLNCLLTAHWAGREKREVSYVTIEKFPLSDNIIKQLNYGRFIADAGEQLFSAIHAYPWNREVQVTPYFSLLKIQADFILTDRELPQKCNVVYFDAFGPDKQPEMWTQALFNRIYQLMQPGGIFVTYSAKGEVRRRLISSGFGVEKIPGPPGKKEMLRGIKM
jgi:tRNA U34 5-methylaminomethyl-2-thiouridine-forming methyltransferase MnmC